MATRPATAKAAASRASLAIVRTVKEPSRLFKDTIRDPPGPVAVRASESAAAPMAMNLQSTQMLVPGTGMLPDRNGRYPPVEVGGGNKYTGDWHRGSMHGKGEYEFADGRR